jgi:CheY-like chemotaxis protein
MSANSTLLCIHRDPAQLTLLEKNGYELVTANNGREGLRLFKSRPVDAIVLEYHLDLLDGSGITAEIKRVRPYLPTIMLADHAELPDGALKSVDVLVSRSDPPHFLWAAVHFVLNVKSDRSPEGKPRAQTPARLRRPGRFREGTEHWEATTAQLAADEQYAPFSPRVWKRIRNGSVQF